MACYDGLISIKGLCESSDNTIYYLDDLGISLLMAAKTADERWGTGKKMIEAKIEQGWKEVLNDIQFKGLNANKILNDDTIGVISTDVLAATTGYKGISFTLDKHCKLSRFFIHKITLSVATGGATVIRLTQGTTSENIYSGTPNDGDTVEVLLNEYVSDFTVDVLTNNITVYSGSPVAQEGCGCSQYYTVTGTETYGLTVDLQVRCDKDRHSCKFADKIASAARYKIAALIWNDVYNSNAFNDLLNIKKEKAVEMMAWLDSSYNLLKYDPSTTVVHQGMYQKEMKTLNLPTPKCLCCVECKHEKVMISLP